MHPADRMIHRAGPDRSNYLHAGTRRLLCCLGAALLCAPAWALGNWQAATLPGAEEVDCAPASRAPISVAEFDHRTAAAQLNLAARLKVSDVASERAQALYLDYAATLHSGKGQPALAQELARTARSAQGAGLTGLAFTACHLIGPDQSDGDCRQIDAAAWLQADHGSPLAQAGIAVASRSTGDDRSLDAALHALAQVKDAYRAFVPLAPVLQSRAFTTLPPLSQQLLLLNMWSGMNALSLKPLLINYCSAAAMAAEERKETCTALSVALVKTSPLLSDRVEALRILKQSGRFSREERAGMAGRLATLRKLVRKDLIVDRDLTCTALSKRAQLAWDVIQDGEIAGYEKYFLRQQMHSAALP